MTDVISRQDAIDALMNASTPVIDEDGKPTFLGDYISVLQELPSAEPERKTGRWISDIAYYDEEGCPCIVSRCNQCSEANQETNYCPNCGAKMEVEDDS